MISPRLRHILAQVFDTPAEQFAPDSGPDDIEAWDSVNMLNLALALEAEYGVRLEPDDIADMLSVKLVSEILRERGVVP